mmetsp:Transcript_27151/g.56156  ORF Transcript_27151/g.56156 Transcript_27151/m.56156 type:complete len:312 (+) Transcript_27151:858-1793(+)
MEEGGIIEAIYALDEKSGSSSSDIMKYIELKKLPGYRKISSTTINSTLASMLKREKLIAVSGRYKLTPQIKKLKDHEKAEEKAAREKEKAEEKAAKAKQKEAKDAAKAAEKAAKESTKEREKEVSKEGAKEKVEEAKKMAAIDPSRSGTVVKASTDYVTTKVDEDGIQQETNEGNEEGEGRYLRGSSSYAAAKPRELEEGKKKEAKKVKKMKKLKDHVVKKKPATKKAKKINKKDGTVQVIKINEDGGRFLRESPSIYRGPDSAQYLKTLSAEVSGNDSERASFKIPTSGALSAMFMVGMILVWHKRRATH